MTYDHTYEVNLETVSEVEEAPRVQDSAPLDASLVVSVVEYPDPVGKSFGVTDAGLTKKQLPRPAKAIGRTIKFSSVDAFVEWRKNLTSNTMLLSGTFKAIGQVPVVYKGNEGPGEASASKKCLSHRRRPGVLIIDIDYKDEDEVFGLWPEGLQKYTDQDSALADLDRILPEAEACAAMIGWSTSSNISDRDGNQMSGPGGLRIYLFVSDASQIPELLETMHNRCWLHRLGWAFVGEGGRIHERSLVDLALARVTQPDFAAPDLNDGLTQDRDWQFFEGDVLDPADVSPLTPEEEEKVQRAVAEAKEDLKGAQETAKAAWIDTRVERDVSAGVLPARARSNALRVLDKKILSVTDEVYFRGKPVSCEELLNDGSKYDGKTCLDPVEPGYNGGAEVGIFYWNAGGAPGIHSFAHGGTFYRIQHDRSSLEAVVSLGDTEAITKAFALTAFTGSTEKVKAEIDACKALGLGRNVKAFRNDVEELEEQFKSQSNLSSADSDTSIANARLKGRWPLNKPLPGEWFPFLVDGSPLQHVENFTSMLEGYGITTSYDVLGKEMKWEAKGIDSETDNANLALFAHIRSLAVLNGLAGGNDAIHTFLPAIAEANQVNKAVEYFSKLEWDGKDRLKALTEALGAHDPVVALISITRWLIETCAAADGAVTARALNPEVRATFEYVLALLGGQGVGKTKGLANLIPKSLHCYIKQSVVLDIKNKDSIKQSVSGLVAELGELDATFKTGDYVAFKAFMSREDDELRMPFAATTSRFRRRTVFVGTVNDPEFLKDKTGARRFFPLAIDRGFPVWPDGEIDQLWAQVWSLYSGGEQWWPTVDEESLLAENAEQFRQKSWIEERLASRFQWGEPPVGNARHTASDVWSLVQGHVDPRPPTPRDLGDIGHALRRLWSGNGGFTKNGILVVQSDLSFVHALAKGGKNTGWVLPPKTNISGAENFPGMGEV